MNKLIIKLNKERVFYIGFSLYLIVAFIRTTMFIDIIPSIFLKFLKYLELAFIFCKIIFMQKYSKNKLIIAICCGFIFLLSFCFSTYRLLLEYLLIIIAAKDVPIKKIIKIYLIIVIPMLIITIVCSKLGVIENLIYSRNGKMRQALGVNYPTDFAAYIFFITLAYIALKDGKMKLHNYLVILIIAILVYELTNARLDVISIFIVLFLLFINQLKINLFKTKIIKYFFICSFLLFSFMAIFFTINYNPDNSNYVLADKLFSGRLRIGNKMYNEYGIKMFGQEIDDHGWGGDLEENYEYEEYNYIDSSYLRIILKNGLIVFILIMISNLYLCYKFYNNKQYIMLIVCFMISLNSLVAQHYTDFSYNFLITAYMARLPQKNENKLEEQKNV